LVALDGVQPVRAHPILVPLERIAPGLAARAVGTGPAAAGLDFQRASFPLLSEPQLDAAAFVRLAGNPD